MNRSTKESICETMRNNEDMQFRQSMRNQVAKQSGNNEEINNEEDFIRAMMETPYTLGDDIEDRNSRLGSSQQYDIYENGGVETYNTVALKKVIPENEYMTRGKKLEPVMAQWAELQPAGPPDIDIGKLPTAIASGKGGRPE